MKQIYRIPLLTLAIALVAPSPGPAAAQPAQAAQPSGLSRLLEAQLSRFPSKSGFYVKHLATGEEAFVNPDMHFESASTIKVAIMVLAYRLSEQGKLNLDERHEIKAADYRGGSGIFQLKDVGLRPTWRDIITQMIVTSDNTATDLMVARVGGVAAVNDYLRGAGYSVLKLNGTTLDYFRSIYALVDPKYGSAPAEDIFALGSEMPAFTKPRQDLIAAFGRNPNAANVQKLLRQRSGDERNWFGIMSPREGGRLMEAIEQGTAASKASCEEMKRILRAQQAGTRKIPHFLSVPVGHKTGETYGVTNDIGIVYARSGPIVITSFNMDMEGLDADGDDRIGAVTRLVVDYFDGAR
ncbi:serine hydrolase [Sphingosinicella rhizophila]|uniref:beta-lactamase n=1 Tax=Sphingosinicella rhizophila TaxID=3050082 RepID=A0ABU3QBC5_9SPHN|nr:serine hydrolase [Sphingosinicella sp. GR2756]MDT9600683.1 serine hydrolase [Sphingosinicella sp. GR2756]